MLGYVIEGVIGSEWLKVMVPLATRDGVCWLLIFVHVVLWNCPLGLRSCKNRAHSVSWLEVIKAVPNQGVDSFVS